MVQYEMCFTNEYTEEIIVDLAREMHLPYLREDFLIAWNERDTHSPKNLFMIKDKARFICINCNDRDWIFSLVVVCDESEADTIKKVMLNWDNMIREEYNQELTEDLQNLYGQDDTFLKHMEKFYNVKLC